MQIQVFKFAAVSGQFRVEGKAWERELRDRVQMHPQDGWESMRMQDH